jgi:hypothetical protein
VNQTRALAMRRRRVGADPAERLAQTVERQTSGHRAVRFELACGTWEACLHASMLERMFGRRFGEWHAAASILIVSAILANVALRAAGLTWRTVVKRLSFLHGEGLPPRMVTTTEL